MSKEREVNSATNVLNNMMTRVSKDGLRVIALCENAEGRMTMLALMEFMDNQNIAILREINKERETKLVSIEGGQKDIPEEMLSKMSPVSEIIEDK